MSASVIKFATRKDKLAKERVDRMTKGHTAYLAEVQAEIDTLEQRNKDYETIRAAIKHGVQQLYAMFGPEDARAMFHLIAASVDLEHKRQKS